MEHFRGWNCREKKFPLAASDERTHQFECPKAGQEACLPGLGSGLGGAAVRTCGSEEEADRVVSDMGRQIPVVPSGCELNSRDPAIRISSRFKVFENIFIFFAFHAL